MQRSLRTTLLLALAVLAMLASACGVEAGSATAASESPGSSADAPQQSTDPTRQTVIDTYMDLGLTQDESECLADALLGMMDEDGPVDNTGIMDAINQCDIPISRLAEIGQAAGGGSAEDGMRFGLETSLENSGLSSSEASCVADEYIAEYGTDMSSAQDPTAMAGLLDACGLTMGDFDN